MGSREIGQCDTPDVLTKELTLCVVRNSGEGSIPSTVQFRATNPSVLLHFTLRIFARPTGGGNSANHVYAGETWQLFATAHGTPEVTLNFVFNDGASPPNSVPQPLPDSYEVETGIKVIEGIVTLSPSGLISEEYIVQATWEPAQNNMSVAERARWFSKCQITMASGAFPVQA